MNKTCEAINKDIKNRLNRLKGQINGVEKMLDERRDSIEIVTQISSIKSSLSSLAIEILKEESQECMKLKNTKKRQESFEEIVRNLFKIT